MRLALVLLVSLLPNGLHAETEATTTPSAGANTSAPASSAPVGKTGCNDLLAKVLKEFRFGEVDPASKKVKGTAESRVRKSPRNGVYLIAAAKDNGPGQMRVIYPAVTADGVTSPAIHGIVGTPRIRSMAADDKFEIQLASEGNSFTIKAKLGGPMPDGQASCTVSSVQADVAVRDKEAEADEAGVRKLQGMDDKNIEPIYKVEQKTMGGEACRNFKPEVSGHRTNQSATKMCELLKTSF